MPLALVYAQSTAHIFAAPRCFHHPPPLAAGADARRGQQRAGPVQPGAADPRAVSCAEPARAVSHGAEPGGERTINEEQEAQSRALVAQAVESAAEQLGIPPERVVVGGFSQGGIMALSLLLTRPALMQAALVWHSRLLQQVVPLSAPADALSHGTHDNVIPLAHAQAIAHHMAPLPVTVTYHEFPSAHEIRPSELAATVAWLESLSTTPTAF